MKKNVIKSHHSSRVIFLVSSLIAFFLYAPVTASQPVSSEDSTSLANFYLESGGESWNNRSGWLEEPVSQWYGVEVQEIAGEWRVTSLELPDNNITIDHFHDHLSFFSLDYLKRLDLSYNQIKLHRDLADILLAMSFNHLSYLEELKLSGNKDLYGMIPYSLTELEDFRLLWLDDTNIREWPVLEEFGAEFFVEGYEWLEQLEDYRGGPKFGSPVHPNLLNPEDGSTQQPLPVQFTWEEPTVHPHDMFNGISPADTFRIQIAADDIFTNVVFDTTRSGNDLFVANPLDHEQQYYWRIQGINEFGAGIWSKGYTFHTMQEMDITVHQTSFDGPVVSGFSMIGEDVLILPVSGEGLHVMDADMNERYTLQVGGELFAFVSIAYDSSMYVASTDFMLYAFNKRGAPKWNAAMGGAMKTTPAVDSVSNSVIIGVENRNVIALDRDTGQSRWSFFASAPVHHSAVIGSQRVLLVPASNGTIYAVDLDSELEEPVLWEYSLDSEITANPALGMSGTAYFVTDSNELICLNYDRQGANEQWRISLEGGTTASPVIGGDNRIYVAAESGHVYSFDGLTGSKHWEIELPHPFTTTPALNGDRLYTIDQAGHVYSLSTDGSVLWNLMFDEYPSGALLYSAGSLFIGSESGNAIKITESGVMLNKDQETTDLQPLWSSDMGNNQRTGVQPSGILTASSGELTSSSNRPRNYKLHQSYPNPFNATTVIRFELPVDSQVDLGVFDVLGRRLFTLVSENLPAGQHQTVFNATGLSSGTYIYRLQAGSYTQTRRMMLIK